MLCWGSCAAIHAGTSFRPKNCRGLSYFVSLPTRTTQRQLKRGRLARLRLNMCVSVFLDQGQSTENLGELSPLKATYRYLRSL